MYIDHVFKAPTNKYVTDLIQVCIHMGLLSGKLVSFKKGF